MQERSFRHRLYRQIETYKLTNMDIRFTLLTILLVVVSLTYTNASCEINGVTYQKGGKH
jgi:hypothetical protein